MSYQKTWETPAYFMYSSHYKEKWSYKYNFIREIQQEMKILRFTCRNSNKVILNLSSSKTLLKIIADKKNSCSCSCTLTFAPNLKWGLKLGPDALAFTHQSYSLFRIPSWIMSPWIPGINLKSKFWNPFSVPFFLSYWYVFISSLFNNPPGVVHLKSPSKTSVCS